MADITVAEALRLKNELGQLIGSLQQKVIYAAVGDMYEEGVLTTKKNNSVKELFPLLEKALALSFAVNSTLARFNNSKSSLADDVRTLENKKVVHRILTSILERSEPSVTTTFSTVGNIRVKVDVEFRPFFSKSELKARLKELKAEQRSLQNNIDALNSHIVSLPFELSELEELEV